MEFRFSDDFEEQMLQRQELSAILALIFCADQTCPSCLEPMDEHMRELGEVTVEVDGEMHQHRRVIFNHQSIGTDEDMMYVPVCPELTRGL